jgi:hypothetical protein
LEGKQSGRLDGVLEPNIALKVFFFFFFGIHSSQFNGPLRRKNGDVGHKSALKVFLFFTVLHKQAKGFRVRKNGDVGLGPRSEWVR